MKLRPRLRVLLVPSEVCMSFGGLYEFLPSDMLRKGLRWVIYTDGSSDPGSKHSPASWALRCLSVWVMYGNFLVHALDLCSPLMLILGFLALGEETNNIAGK